MDGWMDGWNLMDEISRMDESFVNTNSHKRLPHRRKYTNEVNDDRIQTSPATYYFGLMAVQYKHDHDIKY